MKLESNGLGLDFSISELMNRWAQVVIDLNLVESWLPGAIFPCEMVLLLAFCECNGIRTIFESGRQDGYSTELLAVYCERQKGRTYSVDVESDEQRAYHCRGKLSGYDTLELVKGNSLQVMGDIIKSHQEHPATLFIDGPKGYTAIGMMMAAAAFPHIRIVALHDLHSDQNPDQLAAFRRIFSPSYFHEELPHDADDAFMKLRHLEWEFCASVGPDRRLDRSSLGVAILPNRRIARRRLAWSMHPQFRRFQPLFLSTYWKFRVNRFFPGSSRRSTRQ